MIVGHCLTLYEFNRIKLKSKKEKGITRCGLFLDAAISHNVRTTI